MGRNWGRDDPVADAEDWSGREAPVIGECEYCHEPIHEGEDYYDIEGTLLHDDCDFDWLRQFKKYN